MTRKEQIEQEAMKRFPHFGSDRIKFIQGAEWADESMIEKACDAYCKVCGHFAHSVPTHICRHDCRYFSDFKTYMKGE